MHTPMLRRREEGRGGGAEKKELLDDGNIFVQFELDDMEAESKWETVPAKPVKSRAVPDAGRKHALPPSEGSPSEPWQVSYNNH